MASGIEALWREFRPGRTIYVPGASGESLALADALRADPERAAGVRFLEEPRREAYGTVAVFLDLYGNKWDLLQPRPAKAGA